MEINRYWITKHQQSEHYPFSVAVRVLNTFEQNGKILYYCELVGKGTAVIVKTLDGKIVTKEQAFVHNALYVK